MSNQVVVQSKSGTCRTTCSLKDLTLTLYSFLVSGTSLKPSQLAFNHPNLWRDTLRKSRKALVISRTRNKKVRVSTYLLQVRLLLSRKGKFSGIVAGKRNHSIIVFSPCKRCWWTWLGQAFSVNNKQETACYFGWPIQPNHTLWYRQPFRSLKAYLSVRWLLSLKCRPRHFHFYWPSSCRGTSRPSPFIYRSREEAYFTKRVQKLGAWAQSFVKRSGIYKRVPELYDRHWDEETCCRSWGTCPVSGNFLCVGPAFIRRLIAFMNRLSASRCTHVVTSQGLNAAETHKFLTKNQRNKIHIVKPEWVIDSVAAGRRRPERLYSTIAQPHWQRWNVE